jgi:NAD(P)-dependent dehydrogenase (short-subunit alcohol dehydrogenase family)
LKTSRVLVPGARGAIGTAVASLFLERDWTVLPATHSQLGGAIDITGPDWVSEVLEGGKLDAVVFAQGANTSGGLEQTTSDDLDEMWRANVAVVAEVMGSLAAAGAFAEPARVVVVSSVWQEVARSGKIAYTASKAAVGGLVRAMAVDLAPRGILVNAVLPGVLDTPMTREHLSAESIARVTADTPAGRLATVEDVARAAYWLASDDNTAVTGQSVAVDLGWMVARSV